MPICQCFQSNHSAHSVNFCVHSLPVSSLANLIPTCSVHDSNLNDIHKSSFHKRKIPWLKEIKYITGSRHILSKSQSNS